MYIKTPLPHKNLICYSTPTPPPSYSTLHNSIKPFPPVYTTPFFSPHTAYFHTTESPFHSVAKPAFNPTPPQQSHTIFFLLPTYPTPHLRATRVFERRDRVWMTLAKSDKSKRSGTSNKSSGIWVNDFHVDIGL